MTLGEACYIVGIDGGKLKHVWFGKRVELEDDLAALDGTSTSERPSEFFIDSGIAEPKRGAGDGDFCPDTAIDVKTGEPIATDFRVVGFGVENIKPKETDMPTLRGGKTLKIALADASNGLSAEIYYTPYSRGGLTRRVAITNVGTRTYRFRMPSGAVRLVGEYSEINMGGGMPINYMGFIGNNGDCYGFALCYGGLAVMASETGDGVTDFICETDDNITLKPKERFVAPEILAVYSDNGADGAARVFHDIIREYAVPERYTGARRPIALFIPTGDGTASAECAAIAPSLGADAFVMPYTVGKEAELEKASAVCKKNNIIFGVKLAPSPEYDLSKSAAVDKVYNAAARAIKEFGAEYVSLVEVCKAGKDREFTVGAYRLLERIASEFPDITIECDADLGSLCYCPIAEVSEQSVLCERPLSLCFPPCVYAARVDGGKPSIKTRFDIASFGCLGYSFDPRALSEDMRRAIRAQVYSYQDDAKLVMDGDLYALGGAGFFAVSKDKSKAYAVVLGGKRRRIVFDGLDEHNLYSVRELDKTFSGAALKYFGAVVPEYVGDGETLAYHFSQVADYE